MDRSLAMLIGAVAAVLAVGVPALLLSGGEPSAASGSAPAVVGVFDFPSVSKASPPAAVERLEAVRPPAMIESELLQRPVSPISAEVAGLPPTEVLLRVEARRHEAGDRGEELELDRLAAEAFDRLWWQRIGQLIAERDAAGQKLASLRLEYARTSDAGRRTAIANELQALARQVEASEGELDRMGYTADAPPDEANAAQMEMLRRQRDALVYDTWQRGVLRSLARTQGRNPWGGG